MQSSLSLKLFVPSARASVSSDFIHALVICSPQQQNHARCKTLSLKRSDSLPPPLPREFENRLLQITMNVKRGQCQRQRCKGHARAHRVKPRAQTLGSKMDRLTRCAFSVENSVLFFLDQVTPRMQKRGSRKITVSSCFATEE